MGEYMSEIHYTTLLPGYVGMGRLWMCMLVNKDKMYYRNILWVSI